MHRYLDIYGNRENKKFGTFAFDQILRRGGLQYNYNGLQNKDKHLPKLLKRLYVVY